MSTMATDETYNGYANRETWAFNLHWSNDEGIYTQTLSVAAEMDLESPEGEMGVTDYEIGEHVVNYWRDEIDQRESEGLPASPELRMMDREVGSWWRIDYREVGEAVREALEAEGD